VYKLEYLPSALVDILEIEDYLFEHSPDAADKFTEAIEEQGEMLKEHPLMYQVYEDNPCFRSMPLPYSYRLFYHVGEAAQVIKIHRVYMV
jgi:plasmid stabilization system protein ParE